MAMQIFDDGATYTQAEVAPKLRKSKSWFERSRWAGTGPRFIKVGRSVLYLGQDLNAWIESQSRFNTSEDA